MECTEGEVDEQVCVSDNSDKLEGRSCGLIGSFKYGWESGVAGDGV